MARDDLLMVNIAVQPRQKAERHPDVDDGGVLPLRSTNGTFLKHGATLQVIGL
jgi:hypothetical protein